FCVVVNEPWYQNREGDLEGTRYESEFSSTNVVKVVYKDGTSSGGVNMTMIIIVALGVFVILLLSALIVLLVVLIKKKK
ncbi:MAG: hypothetical protein J6X87_02340, partial [Clostridia bacterium]|nr:hypothetical protein [Clostridia bacterium]